MIIFHILLDAELVTQIMSPHLETGDFIGLLCCQFEVVCEASVLEFKASLLQHPYLNHRLLSC